MTPSYRRRLAAALVCLSVLFLFSPAWAREVRLLAPGTRYETPIYVIRGELPGPVVMVVGGVHGSERAGYLAAREVATYSVAAGTLLVLPEANRPAMATSSRMAPGTYDLNRAFPTSAGQVPSQVLPRDIWRAVQEFEVEWLLDLHEGFDFYLNPETDSVGQTIIYYPTSEAGKMAETALRRLNRDTKRRMHQFTLVRYPVPGSLARASGEFLGVHAFIFETTMSQPLSTRVAQQLTFVDTVLRELAVIYRVAAAERTSPPLQADSQWHAEPSPHDEPQDGGGRGRAHRDSGGPLAQTELTRVIALAGGSTPNPAR